MRKRGVSIPPIGLPKRDFTIKRGVFAEEGSDFEVRFFESILATCPDHVESLMRLANAYTTRGDHDRGLEIDLRLLRLRPQDPVVLYNLACSYSLLGRSDDALHALERSVEFGYLDREHMEQDEDLANVRADPHYQHLLKQIDAKLARLPTGVQGTDRSKP